MKLFHIDVRQDENREVPWVVCVRDPGGEATDLSAWESQSDAYHIAEILDKQLVALQQAMQFPWEQIAQSLHEVLSNVYAARASLSNISNQEDVQGAGSTDSPTV